MELFKQSKLSICHKCTNIAEVCSMVSKTCETDAKISYAYVSRCSLFQKEFIQKESIINALTVDYSTDTRVEMMGGGYKDITND